VTKVFLTFPSRRRQFLLLSSREVRGLKGSRKIREFGKESTSLLTGVQRIAINALLLSAYRGEEAMKRSAWLAVALLVTALPTTGCVTRRFVITSDPPGALVYKDGQPIGATPVEAPFIYYGKYSFRLVKDGYEPLDVDPELVTPWYEYPVIDFVSENVIPHTFRDVQVLHFALVPLKPVVPEELKIRAQQLRDRGALIQPPPGIIQPRPANPPVPTLPPPAAPTPTLPPPLPAG
jgi:hypothetical protein